MYYNSYAYLINHINFAIKKKSRFTTIRLTRKILSLLRLLRALGYLLYLRLSSKKHFKSYVIITPIFYKTTTFYPSIKLISTPSKKFSVTIKALRIIDKSLKHSILILETSHGLITHKKALRYGIGGFLLCTIL